VTALADAGRPGLEEALLSVAAGARERDEAASPSFPEAAIAALERAGALAFNAHAGTDRPPAADELALVRRIARADGSVGRIADGHLNAVERLAVQAPAALRDRELAAVAAQRLRAGVWGGDPVGGEGPPAQVVRLEDREVLRGVKTFCSGAGGLHRALVLARAAESGPPVTVWVDLTDRRVEIDTTWYRSHGLRASVSHRVVFHDTPILAQFGEPGAISAQPWFSRDALRTAATWAGMADAARADALSELSERPARGPLEALAAGRLLTAHATIDIWIAHAAQTMDARVGDLAQVAVTARAAIADACRTLLDQAAGATGSRPFARGGTLDRARRDLEVFLLQHRLDPLLARLGEAALSEHAS
jgi:hypothetical protein